MRCGVGRRCGSDPELLWLWCWPVAMAPIRPLAWESPYAKGVALEKAKRQKKEKKKGGGRMWCPQVQLIKARTLPLCPHGTYRECRRADGIPRTCDRTPVMLSWVGEALLGRKEARA